MGSWHPSPRYQPELKWDVGGGVRQRILETEGDHERCDSHTLLPSHCNGTAHVGGEGPSERAQEEAGTEGIIGNK